MASWTDDEDNWDADSDVADDDEPTVPCPHCRKEIHEDTPRCPHCGDYVSAEDAPPSRKPWWMILGALACLYAVYRWIVG